MLYNIWAGLIVLSMAVAFFSAPLWFGGFALFYVGLLWVLESGKRKADNDKIEQWRNQ